MEYSITSFDEISAQITVLVPSFPPITISLPVNEEGNVPTGDELSLYINGFLPHGAMLRRESLAKGISNIDEFRKILTTVDETIHSTVPIESVRSLTNAKKINDCVIERDARLTACDWTQLPDVVSVRGSEWQSNWAQYRQELRDITERVNDILRVNADGVAYTLWPVPPSQ